MSKAFREYLRKIGSGPHTGESLNRQEAALATRLMLLQEATPAQIGAFMIAHRIRRPTGEELAGMLDAYHELGPRIIPIDSQYPVVVMGHPYDGRSRTAPIAPIVSLILATVGVPVILHGGDRMPTKEGLPLIELWQGLDVAWQDLELEQVRQVLAASGLGFVYLPRHFPLAQALVGYREEIGKRPPFATLELMWSPYAGNSDQTHQICGFVHPPTENMFRAAFELHDVRYFTTVKGLEGSCDLPRDRTSIIGIGHPELPDGFERKTLNAQDFSMAAKELSWLESTSTLIAGYQSVLAGEPSDLASAIVWSAGFYLWRCQASPDIPSGIALAQELLKAGKVAAQLSLLKTVMAGVR
jgi:anthranilate phosphoribosyltransferase